MHAYKKSTEERNQITETNSPGPQNPHLIISWLAQHTWHLIQLISKRKKKRDLCRAGISARLCWVFFISSLQLSSSFEPGARYCLRLLLLADRSGTQLCLLPRLPQALTCWAFLRCFPAHHCCKEWFIQVTVTSLSAQTSPDILLWPLKKRKPQKTRRFGLQKCLSLDDFGLRSIWSISQVISPF